MIVMFQSDAVCKIFLQNNCNENENLVNENSTISDIRSKSEVKSNQTRAS